MSTDQSSNKRIAKNTLMLYIRMFISMLVGLYTSRVVLQTLGVEDYGIYGVVGGVVSMMGFLNASMSGATSRFITFELGKGDMQRVRDTFSSAMIIHIGIALIVILLAETVGLWFLCNKLVIPEGRMEAAHWVYQCSIISAAVGITQSPYSAVIMSREKMDIYAYMELLNVSLRLGIVYLLLIGNFDKLILYAILTLGVSVLMAMLYRIYCIRKFEESHFKWMWNKKLLKPMLSFSVWDLYGNMSFSVLQQGRSFIVNIFFGVLVNAASGIASTVQGVLQGFSGNIVSAIRPQIIKSFASRNIERMQVLLENGIQFSTLFMMVICVPLILNIDNVLNFWLGSAPVYSSSFCVLLLLNSILNIVSSYLIIGIHANGNVKLFFITGTLSLMQLPIVYLLFRNSLGSPNWVYYAQIMFSLLVSFVLGFIVKYEIREIRIMPIFFHWIRSIIVGSFCCFPLLYVKFGNSTLLILIGHYFIYGCIVSIVTYFLLLTDSQKLRLKNYISHHVGYKTEA